MMHKEEVYKKKAKNEADKIAKLGNIANSISEMKETMVEKNKILKKRNNIALLSSAISLSTNKAAKLRLQKKMCIAAEHLEL